ncbi:MAG: hypothetical protein JWQ45_2177 [Blastococcus sp.]|nr:hypothetical protein [Blastococcus sp.]
MRSLTRLSVVALVGVGTLLPMTAASAADSVTRSGACSATSTWTMRAAEAEGDLAALRLSVNSVRAGDTWSVRMFRQGAEFFSIQRTTNAAGDFTLNRSAREVNDVNDAYTARAQNLRTGEVCSARVVLPD